jgi:ferredoxin--NADP+ reductase
MKIHNDGATPLRVAIVGSGPAGFYVAEQLLKHDALTVEIDLFDRLPTPFGLVRTGVAPDHPKIKSVTRIYERIAADPCVRFYGNVKYGRDVSLEELEDHYHQIVFATGAETDRGLDIPGIGLAGSHTATEFVGWYNGHPDYRDRVFDLSRERVAVIGVGNVAIDVARILCRTEEELRGTDIAPYALKQLAESRIEEVVVLGRRGPVQAAFTNPELKELRSLADAEVRTLPEDLRQPHGTLYEAGDRSSTLKVKILQELTIRGPVRKARRITLRFLVSPVELLPDEDGHVRSLRLVRNVLRRTEAGTMSPHATDRYEDLPVGLVFRSIGYGGVALPDIPFNHDWGVIHNQNGRVIDPDSRERVIGLYAVGWIKRGPTGVIGTNKPDAVETVDCMVEDLRKGAILHPRHPEVADVEQLIRLRQPDLFTYEDWQRLDAIEVARGRVQGCPRIKFTSVDEMLAALER